MLRRAFEVKVWFGIHLEGWNRGFEIDPEASKLLAATGGALAFDLYSNGDEGRD